MASTEPKKVCSSRATATDDANMQAASFNYDALILECLIRNVSFGDLLNCRLVCKEWAVAATKVVKIRSKILPLNIRGIGRMEEFVKMIRGRDEDRCLPFGRYRVNMTENVVMTGPYLSEFFQQISREKCLQLSLYFKADYRDKIEANIEAAKSREGKMGFVCLEELHIFLQIDKKFVDLDLIFLNLSDLLQKSNGLKKLKVKLFTEDNDFYPDLQLVDHRFLECLTMKVNNFKRLQTLDLSMINLDAILVENLLNFDWPLKNLCFDGADFFHDSRDEDRKKGTAFYKLLEKQSGSLESLALLRFGGCLWSHNNFDHGEQCSMGNTFKFPKMPKLLSLELQPAECDWICCNWDLKENNFPQLFPQLKRLDLHDFSSTIKTGNVDFLPNRNYPCETLEELSMPCHHDDDDDGDNQSPIIFYCMILLFPNLRKLEVWYHKETLQGIFLFVPKLKTLWIYNNDQDSYDDWDAIFTGFIDDDDDDTTENQAFYHNVTQSVPRINNLQELEELVVQACRNRPGITDVTADLLLQMENLKTVKFYTGNRPDPDPDEEYKYQSESIKWLFSPSCENRLRQHVNLVLERGNIRYSYSYLQDLWAFYSDSDDDD